MFSSRRVYVGYNEDHIRKGETMNRIEVAVAVGIIGLVSIVVIKQHLEAEKFSKKMKEDIAKIRYNASLVQSGKPTEYIRTHLKHL
jgi:hypothetical protein